MKDQKTITHKLNGTEVVVIDFSVVMSENSNSRQINGTGVAEETVVIT
jgi:hypothetical protein